MALLGKLSTALQGNDREHLVKIDVRGNLDVGDGEIAWMESAIPLSIVTAVNRGPQRHIMLKGTRVLIVVRTDSC